jgi:hypothetical protein
MTNAVERETLFMHDLNRTGEDYSQTGCWDENANFEAESEDGADEKKEDECHFSAPEITLVRLNVE